MRPILEYDTININGKQNVRLEFAHFSHTLHNDLWHCLKSGGFKRGGDFKGARRFCCTSLGEIIEGRVSLCFLKEYMYIFYHRIHDCHFFFSHHSLHTIKNSKENEGNSRIISKSKIWRKMLDNLFLRYGSMEQRKSFTF